MKRYAQYSDAKTPVPAERYMRFPSRKLNDVKVTGQAVQIPDSHPKDARCPAKPALRKGTLVGRIVGRALDESGKPLTNAVLQENYLEARLEISVEVQSLFAKALTDAGNKRFQVPDAFVAAVVSHAYLGQLDVPLALLLVAALAVGALLGSLIGFGRVLRVRREMAKLRRESRATEEEVRNLRALPLRDGP